MTFKRFRMRLRELGHRIQLHRISRPEEPLIQYGVCYDCGLAAEFSKHLADRNGWSNGYGPALRTACQFEPTEETR